MLTSSLELDSGDPTQPNTVTSMSNNTLATPTSVGVVANDDSLLWSAAPPLLLPAAPHTIMLAARGVAVDARTQVRKSSERQCVPNCHLGEK